MNLPTLKVMSNGGIAAQDESAFFGKISNARRISGNGDVRAELVRRANAYPKLVTALRNAADALDLSGQVISDRTDRSTTYAQANYARALLRELGEG